MRAMVMVTGVMCNKEEAKGGDAEGDEGGGRRRGQGQQGNGDSNKDGG